MQPLVSIITPHYNRTALLKQTLQSVSNQNCNNWEVIIVDDQSEDGEWAALQRMASEKVKVMQRTSGIKGPSACRNFGARHAKGEYLIFLDSDDLLAPFCLEQRVNSMQAHPNVDACIFLMKEFEQTPGDSTAIFNSEINNEKWIASFIKNENPWNVTCPVWKKDAFLRMGGFDENFYCMEDPELHLRALTSGLIFKTMYNLPADCFYRMHHFDETKSSFYFNSIYYRIKFYDKLTSGFYSESFIQLYKPEIKNGISAMIKIFLYSRKNQFSDLYNELMTWMKSSGLFSPVEILRYRALLNAGNTNNTILMRLKIKGMCYKLLPV